jgi:hypothetical protein
MAANLCFFVRFRRAYRLFLAVVLVLLAAIEIDTLAAAHAGTKLLRGDSQHRRQRLRPSSWQSATRFRYPRFRARRTISVHTVRGFWRAWRTIRPHDEIVVRDVTFSGEVILAHKQLSDWAQVRFGRGTKFTGASTPEALPAVWISDDSHIRFYGGDVSDSASGGMAGTGIDLYDSTYITWWGFVVHDVGGGGLFLTGINKQSSHLDFKGDVSDWGHNLNWDPHAEKGTGLQGVTIADSNYGVSDSRLAFSIHDSNVGAGLEIGGSKTTDGAWNNTIYLRCRKLSMFAANEGAGNCAEVWGENVARNEFRYIEANDLAGRPYQASGMYPGQSLSTDTVVYGRAIRTNANHVFGGVRWDRHAGTVFRNVLPAN